MPVACCASASSWSTTPWYMLACSRVSDAHANCSTLSGRSGTSDLSALVRRSRNGDVSWRSAAAAATIVVAFDRRREARAELGEVAEQARRDHRHDRPQLAEPVLDRRAGERDVLPGRAACATPWPCASRGS